MSIPPAATMALNALDRDMFFPIAIGTVVFNLGLGLSILRHGGFPRALGWLALVIGIVGITPLGFFAFMATGITIIWTSIALAGQVSRGATPGARRRRRLPRQPLPSGSTTSKTRTVRNCAPFASAPALQEVQ